MMISLADPGALRQRIRIGETALAEIVALAGGVPG